MQARGLNDNSLSKADLLDEPLEDYLYGQNKDKRIVERINKLIREIQRKPFVGVGKPAALEPELSGYWSRSCDFITEYQTRFLFSPGRSVRIVSFGFCKAYPLQVCSLPT